MRFFSPIDAWQKLTTYNGMTVKKPSQILKGKHMKYIYLAAILSTSTLAAAGDQAVNCRMADQAVKLYGEHQASCYSNNPYPMPNVQLSQYVTEQSSQSAVLRSFNYPFPASCVVQLNYYRTIQQQTQVCDYTPAAHFYSSQLNYPVYATIYTSNSTDRDGTIVKTEWLSAGNVIGTAKSYSFIPQTKPASLTLKVTDNQGYSDTVKVY
jgi:hypothetical protein